MILRPWKTLKHIRRYNEALNKQLEAKSTIIATSLEFVNSLKKIIELKDARIAHLEAVLAAITVEEPVDPETLGPWIN